MLNSKHILLVKESKTGIRFLITLSLRPKMKVMLKQILALGLGLVLFSSCSDSSTSEDWVGSYNGNITFTEVMISDGTTFTESEQTTMLITAGPTDDQVVVSFDGGASMTLTIDGKKVDISNTMGSDYTDTEGTLTLEDNNVEMDWNGTYLMDNESYSEDSYTGTFIRQ